MQLARTSLRLALVVGAVASTVAAATHPASAAVASTAITSPAAAPGTVVTSRIAGADRYATAVAISRHQFPAGAHSVYLVRHDAFADAVSAGMVGDGPILLVPGTGTIPASVSAEIRRLAPSAVVAIGGTSTVPERDLLAAAQGRPTKRLAGPDRYSTAVAVSRQVFAANRASAGHVTFVVGANAPADGVAAGVLADPGTPVLPLPATGRVPADVQAELVRTGGSRLVAVGGRSGLSDPVLAAAGAHVARERIDGADRYEVAARLATARGRSGDTVYLARGDLLTDAVASGTLTGGPLLLVPPTGTLTASVTSALRTLAPKRVVAIGGTGSVSDAALTAAKNAAAGRMPTRDIRVPNPYTAKDVLRPGWKVVLKANPNEPISCFDESPAALVSGTYFCGASANNAHACYAKPGYAHRITCIVDPMRKELIEYAVAGSLPKTSAAANPLPLGIELTGGTSCLLRNGGAWSWREKDDLNPWAGCGSEWDHALFMRSAADRPDQRVDGATVQYRYGDYDPAHPVVWRDVATRYYLG